MFHPSDGHDISTNVADLTQPQRDQLRSRLGSEGIDAKWTGFQLTVDGAYETRVTSIIKDVRSADVYLPPPIGGPAPGAPGAPGGVGGVGGVGGYGGPPTDAYGGPTTDAYAGPPTGPYAGPTTDAYAGPPTGPYAGPTTGPYAGPTTGPAYPPAYLGYGASSYGYGYGYPMGPATNPSANTALILGICALASTGLCALLGIPLSIMAIIKGRQGRREIDAGRGMQGGRGAAVAGEIMGWIFVGLVAVGVLLFTLLFATTARY